MFIIVGAAFLNSALGCMAQTLDYSFCQQSRHRTRNVWERVHDISITDADGDLFRAGGFHHAVAAMFFGIHVRVPDLVRFMFCHICYSVVAGIHSAFSLFARSLGLHSLWFRLLYSATNLPQVIYNLQAYFTGFTVSRPFDGIMKFTTGASTACNGFPCSSATRIPFGAYSP